MEKRVFVSCSLAPKSSRVQRRSEPGRAIVCPRFSTGNVIPHYPKERTYQMTAFADIHLNPLFTVTVEATQEAILNALTMATTVIGRDGNKAEALDLKRVREILKNYRSP